MTKTRQQLNQFFWCSKKNWKPNSMELELKTDYLQGRDWNCKLRTTTEGQVCEL